MKFKRIFVVLLTMMILSGTVVLASPKIPEPYAYFNDFAGVIEEEEEALINQALLDIRSEQGFDFVIVTTKETGDETAKGYAVALFEAWGIGEADRDNGVLLLNVTEGEQRSILFEVGYGLEDVFTDVYTGQVLDDLIPFLTDGDYKGAYEKAIVLVKERASNHYNGSTDDSPSRDDRTSTIGPLIMGLVLLYLFLLLFARVTRQWWLYDMLWLILRMLFRGGGRGGFGGGSGGFGGGGSGGGGSSRSY